MDLFRPEVVATRHTRLQGSVILSQPASTELLTLLLLVIVTLTGVWLATGSYARTETVRGVLATDVPSAKVMAPAVGFVSMLSVREGSFVAKAAPLAVIDVRRRDGTGQSITADVLRTVDDRLRLADAQLRIAADHDKNERSRLTGLIRSGDAKLAELRVAIDLQQAVVASNKSLYELLETVQNRGFVSRITYEQRRQNLLSSQQQLAALRQQRATIEGDLVQARANLADVSVAEARTVNDVQISIKALQQQQAQLKGEESYTIVSPIPGRVTALQIGVGRPVRSDIPVMTIIPEKSRLYARLYAPSRAAGFVRRGQEVRLLYDAFPYERFGGFKGRVISVSRAAIDPRDLSDAIKADEPVYRVDVSVERQELLAYGVRAPLQAGMTLSATLVLERRSFFSWLVSPLRAVLRRN